MRSHSKNRHPAANLTIRMGPTPKKVPAKNKFWNIVNAADDPKTAVLTLYGEISETSWWGDEVTPSEFAKDLAAVGDVDTILVRLNSGGGDVFAAVAIGNQLEQHRAKTVCRIDGLCASAATIIACHCDSVEAATDAVYMMHLPAAMLYGGYNERDLDKVQESLKAIKSNIISLYCRKSGKSENDITALLEATKWWTATEAKENGFVDEIISGAVSVENRSGVLFMNSVSTGLKFDAVPSFVKDSSTAAPAANCFSDINPAAPGHNINNKEEHDMEIKTTDDLRAAYPDLVKQIEDAAAQAATAAERARIKSIEDMALPGSEELAEQAKFGDKAMEAQDFAMALVKDAKSKGATYLANATNDAKTTEGVKNDAGAPGETDGFMDAIRAINK